MKKETTINSIVIFIVGLLIGYLIFFVSTTAEKTPSFNSPQGIYKNPFGFNVWDTINIQEIRFNVEVGSRGSVNDCTIHLRNNYENPNFWVKSENKYQCILYSVNNNIADCACEYIRKNLN